MSTETFPPIPFAECTRGGPCSIAHCHACGEALPVEHATMPREDAIKRREHKYHCRQASQYLVMGGACECAVVDEHQRLRHRNYCIARRDLGDRYTASVDATSPYEREALRAALSQHALRATKAGGT